MLDILSHRLEEKGSVIAYNMSFEKSVLKKAADLYPQYADWIKDLLPRFRDLLVPFRGFLAYHPNQHGSCSIKAVLPSWTDTSYAGLEIADGQAASREFMRVTFGEDADASDRATVMANLEIYCELDTMAMVDLLRVLDGLATTST